MFGCALFLKTAAYCLFTFQQAEIKAHPTNQKKYTHSLEERNEDEKEDVISIITQKNPLNVFSDMPIWDGALRKCLGREEEKSCFNVLN